MVVIPSDVQTTYGLRMIPELMPGDDLQQFLQRTEPTGHRDERVRLFRRRVGFTERGVMFAPVHVAKTNSSVKGRDEAGRRREGRQRKRE